jgi:ribosomal protein L30E
MSALDEIRKRLEKGNVTIGTKSTIDNLKLGKLEKVFVTKNCPGGIKSEIRHLADSVEVVELDMLNSELGVNCKKPFSISVVGFLRGESK